MKKPSRIKLELLAPAKNADIAIEAIKHGADAVYMGASKFGARAAATNSLDDIRKAVDFAHKFNARIYVTINTILFDDELKDVERLIAKLYNIGVDAIIVQDLAILRLNLPPIELHASTQCDIRTPDKAEFLEKMGFSQLVLARELSCEEITAIRDKVSVPLEAFIHGALCVSYSGRCGISYACMNRSANRGECAQMCRLPYNLEDEEGNVIIKNKHLLSLKDLNQSINIQDLIKAGVTSFKIEGRLKDVDYVKTIVAYYRELIDKFISENSDKYERSSCGNTKLNFIPQPDKVFNRSFTSYFLKNRNPQNGIKMASIDTPKSQGEYIGRVVFSRGQLLKIDTKKQISNGDGLSYFEGNDYTGFRVNRVDGNILYPNQRVNLKKGTELYRTFNKKFTEITATVSAERTISVDFELRYNNNLLILDAIDERGNEVTSTIELEEELQTAKSKQDDRQIDVLSKLGNTIYRVNNVAVLGDLFVPNSILAELRRKTIDLLDSNQKINYNYNYRKAEDRSFRYFNTELTHTDNVSNKLSEAFYREHGVEKMSYAIETRDNNFINNEVLMHTRYCVLRELGYCRKDKKSQKLSTSLYLVNDRVRMRIETDCFKCEMRIYKDN